MRLLKEKTVVGTVNEALLEAEVVKMLENENPLTGIYSIYGDYPIEIWEFKPEARSKFLERMNVVR